MLQNSNISNAFVGKAWILENPTLKQNTRPCQIRRLVYVTIDSWRVKSFKTGKKYIYDYVLPFLPVFLCILIFGNEGQE